MAVTHGTINLTIPFIRGADMREQLITLVKQLNNGEDIEMTVLAGGDVVDVELYFEENFWHLGVIQYNQIGERVGVSTII